MHQKYEGTDENSCVKYALTDESLLWKCHPFVRSCVKYVLTDESHLSTPDGSSVIFVIVAISMLRILHCETL